MRKLLVSFLAVCMILSCIPVVFAGSLTEIELAGRSDACDFFSNGMNNSRDSIDTVSGGECALLREAGEWVSYDISSLASGTYDVSVKILNNYVYQAILGVYIDDILNISYATYRTNTGWSEANHTEVALGQVYIPAGAKEIKVKNDGVGANIEISLLKLTKATDGDTASRNLRLWTSNITSKEDYSDYWSENPDGPAPTASRTADEDYYIDLTESYTVGGNYRNWDGQNYAILRVNDWGRYDIGGMKPGTYEVTASAGSSVGTKVDFLIDEKLSLEATFAAKGNYTMEEVKVGKIYIPQGAQYLKLRSNVQAIYIDYLDFKYVSAENEVTTSKTYPVPFAVHNMTDGMTTDAADYKNGSFYDSAKTGLHSMSGKTVVLYGTEWIKFSGITELPYGTYQIKLLTCTQNGATSEATVKAIDAEGNVLETITQTISGTGVNWGETEVTFAENLHLTEDVKGLIFENGAGNYGYGVTEITLTTSYDSYNVTFNAENASIEGDSTVLEQHDYTFTVTPNSGAELYSVSAGLYGEVAQNKNTGEGMSETTPILAATVDTTAFPEITMEEDNDSPMAGVLSYKRVIKDELNAGTITTYKSQDIGSFIADKPTTVSFGFWIKESDAEAVYADKGMLFMIYKGGSYLTVSVPLASLIGSVGVYKEITAESSSVENIFTNYDLEAVCTARDNGWAHIVCNFEGLKYAEGYETKGTLLYLELKNVSDVLRQGNKIEMTNFVFLTNEKIKSGYIVYPDGASEMSYRVAAKKLTDGSYMIPKNLIAGDITVNAVAAIAPQEGYIPLMHAKLEGESLFVRTSYDEENDLIQKFIGINSDGIGQSGDEANEPVDFSASGLISKDSESMTSISKILSGGFDEAPPFKYNYSYIGSNHGQSDGVLVMSESHGKTYADIGSQWTDEAGIKWNLLRIKDANTLLFISDNMYADDNKYRFTKAITGTTLVCTDSNYAENTDDITVESAQQSVQVLHANKKIDSGVYGVIDGAKYSIVNGQTIGCDYVEIVEHYQVMNPALIGKTLRDNRPEGGYSEPQNLAIGQAIIDFNMIYRIMPDGTVISEFDHTILENINFDWYSGIMYQLRADAYGGGVYRYIPKTKSFDMTLDGMALTYDFTEPYNVTQATLDKTYIGYSEKHLTSDLWENPESMPDRQIDYMYDENSDVKAGFAAGYLPIADGEPSVRAAKTSSANYLYRSGKAYPIFVNSVAFTETGTKNQKISGVGYKKYIDIADKTASMYTIPYSDDTYIYIDFHETGAEDFVISDILKDDVVLTEYEKSENISYSVNNGTVSAEMETGDYGYLVLVAKSSLVEAVSVTKNTETGQVSATVMNNSLENASAEIVIAGYKEGRMTDVKKEVVYLGGKQKYDVEVILAAGEFDKVKVFVWKSEEEMVPLSPSMEQ